MDLPALLQLWSEPDPDDDLLLERFSTWYADPVLINGTPARPVDLLAKARSLQRGLAHMRHEVIEVVEAGDRLVFAFLLHAEHTGPLATPLGDLAPTGRSVTVRVVDVVRLLDGRIVEITMVADELGMLGQLGAIDMA